MSFFSWTAPEEDSFGPLQRSIWQTYTSGIPPLPPGEVSESIGNYFKAPTDKVMAFSAASELPDGRAWEAKYLFTKILYAMVFGWAGCFNVYRRLVETIAREMDINTTNDLISEWEESVQLPDSRIEDSTPDLSTRRSNVIERLKKTPTVSIQEIQDKIDLILPNSGIWITTGQGQDGFQYDFQYSFGNAFGERARFVMFVYTPEFALDQISWNNLVSWLKDFGHSGVLWVQRIIPKDQSYVVITYPQNTQTIYSEQDELGNYQDINVKWKQIDKLNTVVNVTDSETITPATTSIDRQFTDSDSALITGSTTPNLVNF